MSLFKKVREQISALPAVVMLLITTCLAFIPILLIACCKLIPYKTWQIKCTKAVDKIVTLWCAMNNLYIDKIQKIRLDIDAPSNLNLKNWYLVVANHQSWLDIVILHRLFNRKIPVLKFFIKDSLKWIPLLGFSWWAMGCPFMKRYSKEYIAKYPHKKGKDLLSTQKAVETFKKTPAAVTSFIEGTRFTANKKAMQKSPYTHLLKPKAGGISFIISTMGQQITSILDVTIVYGETNHSLWDFLCQRVRNVKISIREIPIPKQFISNQLIESTEVHNEFKEWLNQRWAEKDNLIASLK